MEPLTRGRATAGAEPPSAASLHGRQLRPSRLAAGAFVAAFLALKLYAGFPYLFDDEHRYFAMGQLISGGALPYRDFILTHPPLGVLLIGLCDAVFGSHYLLYKGLLLLFSALLGFLLFLTVEGEHGPLAAFFSCALLFSAETYFIESSYMRGLNLGLLLVALASLLSRRQARQWLAGVVFGLAFLTGLYAVIPLVTFGAFQLVTRGGKRAGEMLGGFLLTTLPCHLALLLIAGRSYVEQVYLLHTHREAGWAWTTDMLGQVASANLPLLACGLLGLLLVRGRALWQERLFLVGFLPAILSFAKIFRAYFLMPIYFLAIAGGVLLARACCRAGRFKPLAALALTLVLALSSAASFRDYLTYNRRWVVPGVEEITETICSQTAEGDLIFGGLVAPLFSFLSGRRVLANALYTDMEVFATGLLDLDSLRAALSTDPGVKFVVMTHWSGYLSARGGRLNRTLSRHFRPAGRYLGPEETIYLLRRFGAERGTRSGQPP